MKLWNVLYFWTSVWLYNKYIMSVWTFSLFLLMFKSLSFVPQPFGLWFHLSKCPEEQLAPGWWEETLKILLVPSRRKKTSNCRLFTFCSVLWARASPTGRCSSLMYKQGLCFLVLLNFCVGMTEHAKEHISPLGQQVRWSTFTLWSENRVAGKETQRQEGVETAALGWLDVCSVVT